MFMCQNYNKNKKKVKKNQETKSTVRFRIIHLDGIS